MIAISIYSSCPAIAVQRTASLPLSYGRRASTSFFQVAGDKDVDGRDAPGHDASEGVR
jgi:hypothetical protein